MARELIINEIKYTGCYINGDLEYWRASKNIANIDAVLQIPAMLEDKPVLTIGNECFVNASHLREVILPNSIQCIGEYAFAHCENLSKVSTYSAFSPNPNPLRYVIMEKAAFQSCGQLKAICLDKPCRIQDSAVFQDCTCLENLGFGNRIYGNMLQDVFQNCIALKTLYFLEHVLNISADAFGGCNNLKELIFDSKHVTYDKSIERLLFNNKIHCSANCNLVELAYEGANIIVK